jgi:hypothetical protein
MKETAPKYLGAGIPYLVIIELKEAHKFLLFRLVLFSTHPIGLPFIVKGVVATATRDMSTIK